MLIINKVTKSFGQLFEIVNKFCCQKIEFFSQKYLRISKICCTFAQIFGH